MRGRWLALAVLLGACGDGGEPDSTSPGLGAGATVPGTLGAASATANTPATNTGGSTNTGTVASSGSGASGSTPASSGSAGASGAAGSSNGLPCNVQTVLKDKCQTCHGSPLMSGPMPLITRADLLAASTVVAGSKISDRVKARIHDTAKPMPPAARPALTSDELKVLDGYLAAGAPASSETCAAPASAEGGQGKLGDWQPPDSDCEIMYELRAHGGQTEGDTTPYEAPTGGDHYEMFYLRPTWTKKMHVIRIDPLVDNGAVLHHWLLYMEDGSSGDIGTHKPDLGLQTPNSQLLSGWAPGNKSIALGKEVGMQVIQGPNARFAMELHYNTAGNPPDRKDRSGARLCLTSKLRPKEAGTHWLGTQAIANLLPTGGMYEAGDTCTPKAEAHIIAYSPHMHKYGRAQRSIIMHKDGTKETINDGPFAFTDQEIFPVNNAAGEIVVKPGDVITTTCVYDGSSFFTFGQNTGDEMCYNFVVAWPAGSLSNGSTGVVGGKNSCIDTI